MIPKNSGKYQIKLKLLFYLNLVISLGQVSNNLILSNMMIDANTKKPLITNQ